MQVNESTQLYDEQTESYLLHCLINEPEIVQDEIQGITSDHFINPVNQMVFSVCTELLENNELNPYNVQQKARDAYKSDLTDFILEVQYTSSSVLNVSEYALKLKYMGILRSTLKDCEQFHQKAQEVPLNEIISVLDEIQETFESYSGTVSTNQEFDINEAMKGAITKLQGIQRKDPEYYGISTGLFALDQLILGLKQNELIILGARPSIGKCLAKDTPVLMYGGEIKMSQNVKEGDLLTGPDGNPRKVESLARGRENMWKVTPCKGKSYVVNESHILSFKLNSDGTKYAKIYNGEKYYPGDTVNLCIKDYLALCTRKKHHLKGWKSGLIEFPSEFKPSKELPPYMLGLWLGDGSNSKPAIHNPDKEIHTAVENFAQSIDCTVSYGDMDRCPALYISAGRTGGRTKNPLFSKLRQYDLPQNKHIPQDYLTGSVQDRFELLAGLLDSDGYYNGSGLYEIITKYEKLKDGIEFLCNSLGLRVCT